MKTANFFLQGKVFPHVSTLAIRFLNSPGAGFESMLRKKLKPVVSKIKKLFKMETFGDLLRHDEERNVVAAVKLISMFCPPLSLLSMDR